MPSCWNEHRCNGGRCDCGERKERPFDKATFGAVMYVGKWMVEEGDVRVSNNACWSGLKTVDMVWISPHLNCCSLLSVLKSIMIRF